MEILQSNSFMSVCSAIIEEYYDIRSISVWNVHMSLHYLNTGMAEHLNSSLRHYYFKNINALLMYYSRMTVEYGHVDTFD